MRTTIQINTYCKQGEKTMEFKVYGMNRINNDNFPPTSIDGLIIFYTQEGRSFNAIDQLLHSGSIPSSVLVLSLHEDYPIDIDSMTTKYKTNITIFSMENELSSALLPYFREINGYIKGKNSIGIDISSMPIPMFAQIFHFLFKRHNDKKIVVYYSEPQHYNLEKVFDFTAFHGEIDIKVIPGFEGKTSKLGESQRTVFYLMGFETRYLSKIIPQEINPYTIFPINGFPAYFPKYKDISLINNDVNFQEKGVEVVFAEANNPFETYNQMFQLKGKNTEYCIDIIPTGTKPMALGACLLALKEGNNDVRILFPFPTEYKNNQSIGNGVVWEYILN